MSNIIIESQTEFLEGPQGASGNAVLSGTNAPVNGQGSIGNFYLNTTTGESYGPKTITGWGDPQEDIIIGLSGNMGPRGIAGPRGEQGPPVDICTQDGECLIDADCSTPMAVAIDARISKHIVALFESFSPCDPTAPVTIDSCERPYLVSTVDSMKEFFASLRSQISCPSSSGQDTCDFSLAIEEKIKNFVTNLFIQARCYSGTTPPDPLCAGDTGIFESVVSEMKGFLTEQVIERGLKYVDEMVKASIAAVCSGSVSPITLNIPCSTQEDNNLVTLLSERLYDTLKQYSSELALALTGSGCDNIKGFLSDVLGAGISINGAFVTSNYISFNYAGCTAYAGTDKLYLECENNSILVNHDGIFLNRQNGDTAGIDIVNQTIYMRQNNGEYFEASPSGLFLTDGNGTDIEINQNSLHAQGAETYEIKGEKTGTDGAFLLDTSGELYVSAESGNYISFGTTAPPNVIQNSDNGLHAVVEDSKLQFTSNNNRGLMKATIAEGEAYSKIRSTPDITHVNVSDSENDSSVSIWGSGVDINFGESSPNVQINTHGLYASIPSSDTQLSLDENGLTLAFESTGNVTIVDRFGNYVVDWTQPIVSEVRVEAGKAGVRAVSQAGQVVVWGNAEEDWDSDHPTDVEITTSLGLGLYATSGNKTEIDTEEIKITDTDSGSVMSITVPTKGGQENGDKLSASWREIDICVGGVAKKTMVMMTAPYDP
jgi:hypothetical protein